VLTPTELHWDNSNKRLGIGTSTPATTLHVLGSSAALLTLDRNTNTANYGSGLVFRLRDSANN